MKRWFIYVMMLFALTGLVNPAAASRSKADSAESWIEAKQNDGDQAIMPMYEYTDSITASLSFSGGKAYCSGIVSPLGNYKSFITVTLYMKNGNGWSKIDSWSGSATNGNSASASGFSTVERGTYKVISSGNVNGKEFPTKSITRIY